MYPELYLNAGVVGCEKNKHLSLGNAHDVCLSSVPVTEDMWRHMNTKHSVRCTISVHGAFIYTIAEAEWIMGNV